MMVALDDQFAVVSIGDLVVDLIVAIPHLPVEAGKHQVTRKIQLEPGGAGNLLIAGSRLGMRMIALGTIGDDAFGKSVVEILEKENVEISGIIQQPGTESTAVVVLVDDSGEHVFLGGYGEGDTIPTSEIWHNHLNSCDAVFASGWTLQERRLAEAALEAMEKVHVAGKPVFFDPGPEMQNATSSQIEAVLASSDVLLMTEDEIKFVTGGDEGIDAVQKVLELGPQVICVKRGSAGCMLLTKREIIEHPGYPVKVRDTNAAGDSFAAAFIYGYLRGWTLADIAAFANAMGAAKVRKVGSGRQVPTREEVQAVLEQFQINIDF